MVTKPQSEILPFRLELLLFKTVHKYMKQVCGWSPPSSYPHIHKSKYPHIHISTYHIHHQRDHFFPAPPSGPLAGAKALHLAEKLEYAAALLLVGPSTSAGARSSATATASATGSKWCQ